MKKYLVVPGWVISRTDGQRHWISANRLIRDLYHVPQAECVAVYEEHAKDVNWLDFYRRYNPCLIELHPREDGNYDLPQSDYGIGEQLGRRMAEQVERTILGSMGYTADSERAIIGVDIAPGKDLVSYATCSANRANTIKVPNVEELLRIARDMRAKTDALERQTKDVIRKLRQDGCQLEGIITLAGLRETADPLTGGAWLRRLWAEVEAESILTPQGWIEEWEPLLDLPMTEWDTAKPELKIEHGPPICCGKRVMEQVEQICIGVPTDLTLQSMLDLCGADKPTIVPAPEKKEQR